MTNRDLLTEAIADAKAVKETAIANAKASLEESFSPLLKSMLAQKLEEMEKEDDMMEEAMEDDMMEETMEDDMMEEAMEDDMMEEDLEEVNLDELLNELEIEEETVQEEVEDETPEEEETEETEELDLEDMSEDDLKQIIEDVISSMVEAGELEPGESFGEEEMGKEDEELDLEIEDDELEEMMDSDTKNVDEYQKELNEAYETINTLKQELQEINLLNAKLLYTNKIFKTKNLEESKKVKILKSFDKAETIKEAKLVYESLLESLEEKPSKSSHSVIKEMKSMASKPVGKSSVIVETNDMVKRFQKLAGII